MRKTKQNTNLFGYIYIYIFRECVLFVGISAWSHYSSIITYIYIFKKTHCNATSELVTKKKQWGITNLCTYANRIYIQIFKQSENFKQKNRTSNLHLQIKNGVCLIIQIVINILQTNSLAWKKLTMAFEIHSLFLLLISTLWPFHDISTILEIRIMDLFIFKFRRVSERFLQNYPGDWN